MASQPQGTTDAAADAIESLLTVEVEAEATEVVEETEVEQEEVETVEAEAEAEEAEEPEEVEEETAESEEDLQIQSLADLAEALELPLEELLGQIKHTVKVNGETLEIPLNELQAGYQKDSDYRQKTEALNRDREQFEQQYQERIQAFEADHTQNAMIVNTIEQGIIAQLNSEDMAKLRESNPQEWTMRRMDMQDRLNGLQQVKQDAAQRFQQMRDQMQQEQQQKLVENLQKEAELLGRAIPDWGSETQQAVNNYLSSTYGYSNDELQAIADHRAVVIANKARMWDEYQAQAEKTVQKVKKAPKLVKPAAKKPTVKADKVRSLRNKLNKSHKTEDAASLIEELL